MMFWTKKEMLLMMGKWIYSLLFFSVGFLGINANASPWEKHQFEIQELERSIYKSQQELDTLVEKKKNTRERARIEQTLQRIVEIHAELISLRKDLDTTREHLIAEHPDKAHVLDEYDSRMSRYNDKAKKLASPLSRHLDKLLMQVQLKFSSFINTQDKKEEVVAVERAVNKKRKKKREREADVYLRKRSKVKLTK